MLIERTFDGWEARLRARGLARYFGAAFLSFWLCGWAAGEVFALAGLVGITWQAATGQPIHSSMPSIGNPATALPIAGFLLLWLALWTFGGITACWAFLRMLLAEDQLLVRADSLTVIRRAGPVHRTQQLPRDSIRRFYRIPGTGLRRKLMAEATIGAVQITELATVEELDRLEPELIRELGLKPVTTTALPPGWEQIPVPEGGTALVESPAKRRRNAIAVAVLASLGLLLALWSAGAGHLPAALFLGGLTVFAGWAAWRMLLGRYEWRWSGGGFRLDWRSGGTVRTVFKGVSLELGVTSDSDSDDWYELAVFETPPPKSGLPTKCRKHKYIARTMRDPLVPRALGEWLAREAGQPLLDNATSAALSERTEELRKHLEASGKLGSWIAKMIPPASGRK
ncbi:MAG: hypothetical protein IPL39_05625 [Opitutaceae bacterium]|nr:hypothetical protein [Opitutaceae bacterium]